MPGSTRHAHCTLPSALAVSDSGWSRISLPACTWRRPLHVAPGSVAITMVTEPPCGTGEVIDATLTSRPSARAGVPKLNSKAKPSADAVRMSPSTSACESVRICHGRQRSVKPPASSLMRQCVRRCRLTRNSSVKINALRIARAIIP
ncbi:MAG: hypothetical protein KGL11_02685 [Alphaproteobacteria bacterium]|nr:hypothetical protein [Alphaproteobacteria bacterium]